MFEEIATSSSQLLIIIFGIIFFSIVAYGALWMRTKKRTKEQ